MTVRLVSTPLACVSYLDGLKTPLDQSIINLLFV